MGNACLKPREEEQRGPESFAATKGSEHDSSFSRGLDSVSSFPIRDLDSGRDLTEPPNSAATLPDSAAAPPNSAVFPTSLLNGAGSSREPELNGATGTNLRRFTLTELAAATDDFSKKAIVSEGGMQSPNVVYKGKLKDVAEEVAIKRFFKAGREDWDELLEEAHRVADLKHPNITRLIGYCLEGHGALVSEYMPNSTLAQHLLYWSKEPMQWGPRLDVATRVSQALAYLASIPGVPLYGDLNPYRVLFDEEMRPKLSCFGLLNKEGEFSDHLPPETGAVTERTVVYMLGALLLCIFSGRKMNLKQFVEFRHSRQEVASFLDSELRNKPGAEQAMELVPVIVQCLQKDPQDRPDLRDLAEFLPTLDADMDPGMATGLSEFKAAAVARNYPQLHELLCSDHLFPTSEFSFDLWNTGLRGALRVRQQGEAAFRQQNWRTAVAKFDESVDAGVPPNLPVHMRRCFAYMRLALWQQALQDVEQVLSVSPDLLEARCLKAIVCWELGDAITAQGIFDSVS